VIFVLKYLCKKTHLNWNTLLSAKRWGDLESPLFTDPYRNPFERDYDRILFNAYFRQLQNKTQVIPLPEETFVHNRLTHSLEVASVGRSLGKKVGINLMKRNPELKTIGDLGGYFGAIVSAASLAHDIGNPPFGHAGEKAIGEYFSHGKGKQFESSLAAGEWTDLTRFEGNANGFRMLNTSLSGIPGGTRLTYATLGAFTKYPKESISTGFPGASQKKYGFFQSEKSLFKAIARELTLIDINHKDTVAFKRHPLAFLVEAADDICYTIIDFEDGYRLGIISFEQFEHLVMPLCENTLDKVRYAHIQDEGERVNYLRAHAINALVEEISIVFFKHEKQILSGDWDQSLIKGTDLSETTEKIISLSVKELYHHPAVIDRELAGFEVLQGLLDIFIQAMESMHAGTPSSYEKLVVKKLPDSCFAPLRKPLSERYLRLLSIACYVASLTDEQAIQKYRQFKGIEFPHLNRLK
jgi:dGTPase